MTELEAKNPEFLMQMAAYHTELSHCTKFETSHLLLRMNTAHHLISVCKEIEKVAKEKYEEVLEQAGQDPSKALTWLTDCLATSKQASKFLHKHILKHPSAPFSPQYIGATASTPGSSAICVQNWIQLSIPK